jgi:hypothetical protein
LAPAEGKPGGKPARRRSSSIRDAAQTAAGSTTPAAPGKADARPAAKRPRRGTPAKPKGGGTQVKRKAQSTPTKPRRRPGKPLGQTPSAPIDIEAVGIVDVTGGLDSRPIEDPEIPDLPPPEGAAAGGDAPSFPDYQAHSDTWDPFDDAGAPAGRTDPDFDAQRTLGQWLEGVIPPDAQVHFIRAGSEFAKGVQVTVDHHTGRRRQPGTESPDGPNRIEIE